MDEEGTTKGVSYERPERPEREEGAEVKVTPGRLKKAEALLDSYVRTISEGEYGISDFKYHRGGESTQASPGDFTFTPEENYPCPVVTFYLDNGEDKGEARRRCWVLFPVDFAFWAALRNFHEEPQHTLASIMRLRLHSALKLARQASGQGPG